MTAVWESPHVGALLDIGQIRKNMEDQSLKNTGLPFGHGQDDAAFGELVMDSLRKSASEARDLDMATHLLGAAAVIVAWIEDIRARSIN